MSHVSTSITLNLIDEDLIYDSMGQHFHPSESLWEIGKQVEIRKPKEGEKERKKENKNRENVASKWCKENNSEDQFQDYSADE